MDKPKRAPRSKKTVAAAAPAAAPLAESVVGAFGGTVAPAIFIEEVEKPAATPVPTPAAKKSRKAPTSAAGAKKPAVVAVVTPDGIQGSLTGEHRPLIAHLPIHSSDIDNDLFAAMPAAEDDGADNNGNSIQHQPPKPYDPEDVYAQFGGASTAADLLIAASPKAVVTEKVKETAPVVERPSLPMHYSEKLMIQYQDANREQRIPDSTDLACFWDCHSFRGQPCVIPVKIEEDIWRVYGNFCSPECAAAYLFNEQLDSSVQWERYALLNRLYADGEQSVRIAPPRTVLRMFGGNLDVSEYRGIVGDKRMRIDVMTPPMISIIQVMDTKPIDFYDASVKNTFIPWEMDRMNRPGAQGLRLRRTKPVAEKEATLEFCMGIVKG
jgi:hypothetical protein